MIREIAEMGAILGYLMVMFAAVASGAYAVIPVALIGFFCAGYMAVDNVLKMNKNKTNKKNKNEQK
jgi:F0F1-type ATP synthase assembly protein I